MSVYKGIILKLASGTLLAQALSFAFIPAISRIYGPEAFASSAFWMSIGGIIGAVLSLKQEQFFLSRTEDEWPTIASRLSAIYLSATILFFCVALILYKTKGSLVATGMFLAFFYGLSLNLITALGNVANIKGRFPLLNRSRVRMSLALGAFQIAFGLFSADFISLLIGMIGSQVVYISTIWLNMRGDLPKIGLRKATFPTGEDTKKSAASIISAATLAITTSLPPSALYLLGHQIEAGNVAMAQRLLLFPVSLLAMPISQAFVFYLKKEHLRKIRGNAAILLIGGTGAIYSAFFLGAMAVKLSNGISTLLGDAWARADSLLIFVCLLYASLLVKHITNNFFIVNERQGSLVRIDLFSTILMSAATATALLNKLYAEPYLLYLNICYICYACLPIYFMIAGRVSQTASVKI